MKLILARSQDGFLCRDALDDMRWTGKLDKLIFKLLTISDGQPLAVGSATAELLPQLVGRQIIIVSRQPKAHAINRLWAPVYTLEDLNHYHPDCWLIGGPTVALAALQQGFIKRAFICNIPTALKAGIHSQDIQALLPDHAEFKMDFMGVNVEIYTEEGPAWPVK